MRNLILRNINLKIYKMNICSRYSMCRVGWLEYTEVKLTGFIKHL